MARVYSLGGGRVLLPTYKDRYELTRQVTARCHQIYKFMQI